MGPARSHGRTWRGGCVSCLAAAAALMSVEAHAQESAYPWLEGALPARRIASIAAPAGFSRTPAAAGSWAAWLRELPLRPPGTPVRLYNGELKANQDVHFAVVELDVGRGDLQQCADAIMRLRSEYLWSAGRRDEIGFHLTSGAWAPWSRWSQGWRLQARGRSAGWVQSPSPDDSRTSFRRYLRAVFAYAGSLSLERELQRRPASEIQGGDVLIQGGLPGHAVLVLDLARDARGETLLLVGQSYMPAQDFHVLVNQSEAGISPWYRLSDLEGGLKTPEWRAFTRHDLRSFSR